LDNSIIREAVEYCNELRNLDVITATTATISNLMYSPTLATFREENFHDTPQSILEVLKPALALAEMKMLKGAPRFWADIACMMRIPDHDRIKKIGSRAEILLTVEMIT
jgi:hypothetical protein